MKRDWIKLVFIMARLMKILRIYIKEQPPIIYYTVKHLKLLKMQNMNGYQCIIASLVYKCFDKKFSGGAIKSEIMSNQHLFN